MCALWPRSCRFLRALAFPLPDCDKLLSIATSHNRPSVCDPSHVAADKLGACLTRAEGNDQGFWYVAVRNAQALGCGHVFVLVLQDAYPINVNTIRNVPEVCSIFCAIANPVEVLVARSEQGRGMLGVIDGSSAKGVEGPTDVAWWHDLLKEDRVQTLGIAPSVHGSVCDLGRADSSATSQCAGGKSLDQASAAINQFLPARFHTVRYLPWCCLVVPSFWGMLIRYVRISQATSPLCLM